MDDQNSLIQSLPNFNKKDFLIQKNRRRTVEEDKQCIIVQDSGNHQRWGSQEAIHLNAVM